MLRTHLPQSSSFSPEQLAMMSAAFDMSCIALHVFAGDTRGRDIVATRVIDLALDGVTDTSEVVRRIIAESKAAA